MWGTPTKSSASIMTATQMKIWDAVGGKVLPRDLQQPPQAQKLGWCGPSTSWRMRWAWRIPTITTSPSKGQSFTRVQLSPSSWLQTRAPVWGGVQQQITSSFIFTHSNTILRCNPSTIRTLLTNNVIHITLGYNPVTQGRVSLNLNAGTMSRFPLQ